MTRSHVGPDTRSHHTSGDKGRKKSTVVPVVFKPHVEAHHGHPFEFTVLTEPGMVELWRKDKSIPLVDVVQNYSIFMADTGSAQGKLQTAPGHLLQEHFSTKDETVIIEQILQSGHLKGELFL